MDLARSFEGAEDLAERLVADAELLSQPRAGRRSRTKDVDDARAQLRARWADVIIGGACDAEMGRRLTSKLNRDRGRRGMASVLGVKLERGLAAQEVDALA